MDPRVYAALNWIGTATLILPIVPGVWVVLQSFSGYSVPSEINMTDMAFFRIPGSSDISRVYFRGLISREKIASFVFSQSTQ